MSTQAPTLEQIRTGWDAVAAGFDRHVTPQAIRLAEEVLRRVDIRPGVRLLDVGTGSGALALPAARRGAAVVAVDIAPAMIDLLRSRAHQEGLSHIDSRVMDGQALELPDDTFDVSASVNGVSLFPDLAGGLAELVRVTRPGGQVLVAGFGPPPQAEFFGFFLGAMSAAVADFTPPPADPPPLPFQLADPERMRSALGAAGLREVTVAPVTWEMRFESAGQFWDTFHVGNPVWARLAAGLTASQRREVQRVLDGMFRERSGGTPGAVLRTTINVGRGTA